MSRLAVQLLGPFRVTLDSKPISGLTSDKERALLAYLAVEAEQPHRREKLAGLLWPNRAEPVARANLRRALANLRQAIGDHHAQPAFLSISRQALQFNASSDAWVDVLAFRAALELEQPAAQNLRELKQSVALYRGDFLDGFSLKDSVAFDDWTLLTRERLQRRALAALHQLARSYAREGQFERACEYARRQVEMEPWHEEAQQQLMRLLALAGRRSEALAQYDACRRSLLDELGIEPAEQTTKLYQRIREGMLRTPSLSALAAYDPSRTTPLLEHAELEEAPKPTFVAREHELAALDSLLEQALASQGQVVFVSGEAGCGKTALVEEFARRSMASHGELVVASGRGNAYTGAGDPYQPFREVLALLSGDIAARRAAGAISREQALRLWNCLPLASQALVEMGPDLLDAFVSSTALLSRAVAYEPAGAEWLVRLEELQEKEVAAARAGGAQQYDLFEQYGQVLAAIAHRTPLLLVLDDLQWADHGSIDLLFHLRRRLGGQRILIVGTYRPEEITAGRCRPWASSAHSEPHPLRLVLHEFQREFGDITLQVGKDDDPEFVQALVDSEPNRLGADFREMLYRQTRGHALFTVELLRGLQDRGDLLQDAGGRWIEGPSLDWKVLPPRIEGVIGQRIGRLPETLQQELRLASVQGEVFTAEVLARVAGTDEKETIRRLSGELSRAHRLVQAEGLERLGPRSLSHYRFRHFLFQRYLYNTLDDVERPQLHQATGHVIEDFYADQAEDVAVQLARHFQEAGMAWKAVGHLLQAGTRSVRMFANHEAIEHFTRGLALIDTLPGSEERDQLEFALQLGLGAPLIATKGYGSPQLRQACGRAVALSLDMPPTPELLVAQHHMATYYMVRAEFHTMVNIGQQMADAADSAADPGAFPFHYTKLGIAALCLGDPESARDHLEAAAACYQRERDSLLTPVLGQDVGACTLSFLACAQCYLGYADRTRRRIRESIRLAQELDHPLTLASALVDASGIYALLGDPERARELALSSIEIARPRGLVASEAFAMRVCGWAHVQQGAAEKGEAMLRRSLAAWAAMGCEMVKGQFLMWRAEAFAKMGQIDKGLALLAEALAFVEEKDARTNEAEIRRLRAELLLLQGDEAEAERLYHLAIDVARRQKARMLELRGTTSLSRLLQKQGRHDEALELLAEIYGWFTEGFDTADLQEARALLDDLQA